MKDKLISVKYTTWHPEYKMEMMLYHKRVVSGIVILAHRDPSVLIEDEKQKLILKLREHLIHEGIHTFHEKNLIVLVSDYPEAHALAYHWLYLNHEVDILTGEIYE